MARALDGSGPRLFVLSGAVSGRSALLATVICCAWMAVRAGPVLHL